MKRTFVEAKQFKREIEASTESDGLLRRVQKEILANPMIGDIVPGAGGIRKFRLATQTKGKRGGYRVWFLDIPEVQVSHLLVLYSKGESEDLGKKETRLLGVLAKALIKEGLKNGKKK